MHRGSCVCGASTDIARSAVTIRGASNVTWYRSSETARRGFCAVCGLSLFWDPISRDRIGIAMGAFDTPTTTHLAVHMFVAEKGSYYTISDGVDLFEHMPTK